MGSAKWFKRNHYQLAQPISKGIRYHCGLCGVSCKNENGLKCHMQHENHIHKARLAREGAMCRAPFVQSEGDRAFKEKFVKLIAESNLGEVVLAHDIYRQLYPNDRRMSHLEDTCWETLGRFCSDMAGQGIFEANKTFKGWEMRLTANHLCVSDDADNAAREEKSEQADDVTRPNVSAVIGRRNPDQRAANWRGFDSAKRPRQAEPELAAKRAERQQRAAWAASSSASPSNVAVDVDACPDAKGVDSDRKPVSFAFGSLSKNSAKATRGTEKAAGACAKARRVLESAVDVCQEVSSGSS